MARLIDLKAQVIGIRVNESFSNEAFAEKNKLPFPILSDYNRQVINAHGVETPDFDGLRGYIVVKRSIFVVDKNIVVRYVWTAEDLTIEPDYREIENALEKLE
jgi:peroxiredoxin